MELPIEMFWLLIQNQDRITAQSSIQELNTGFTASRGSPEEYQRSLEEKVGHILVIDAPPDPERASKMKQLAME